MSEQIDTVTSFLHFHYEYTPTTVTSLQQYPLAWRVVYRVEFKDGFTGVFKIIKDEQAVSWLNKVASLLKLLETQNYPAQRVLLNRNSLMTSVYAGWSGMLITYIDGLQISPTPTALAMMANSVAKLHALNVSSGTAEYEFPIARWSKERINLTHQWLQNQPSNLPRDVQEMFVQFATSLGFLESVAAPMPMCIVHGDAWYMNAIHTGDDVYLIDWDMSGLGIAIIELAYLLLTSHYDINHPLEIRPNLDTLKSIMNSYGPMGSTDVHGMLLHSMYFCLAEAIASQEDRAKFLWEDSFAFAKLKARYLAIPRLMEVIQQLTI